MQSVARTGIVIVCCLLLPMCPAPAAETDPGVQPDVAEEPVVRVVAVGEQLLEKLTGLEAAVRLRRRVAGDPVP